MGKCVKRIRVGIVGVDKIARNQHIPALRANSAFELVACAIRNTRVDGIVNFPNLESMLDGFPDLDAVAICTPPQLHFETARLALQSGKHVLLEKPPCSTTAQLCELTRLAKQAKITLFQTWHAQFAAAVDAARIWLGPSAVRKGSIVWKEDVRRRHPRQSWIWQVGGLGVFDAGVNALSILTKIMPEPVFVDAAELFFPTNCDAPIAANVTIATGAGAMIDAVFDFRYTGAPVWDIDVDTAQGGLHLTGQGSTLIVDGKQAISGTAEIEYPALYRRFAELIQRRDSDVDARPFQLLADIIFVGRRSLVEPFEE